MNVLKAVLTLVCVFRWEEEYTMRMDLQQKITDLQEVTLLQKENVT